MLKTLLRRSPPDENKNGKIRQRFNLTQSEGDSAVIDRLNKIINSSVWNLTVQIIKKQVLIC